MLNMMTLAELVLFNRRRGGETQRMHVKAYLSRMENPECPPHEVMESLSTTEKCLIKTLSRVEIRGKKGRTVPVLIPNKLQKNIDLLLKHRQEAGVAVENEYIFPRPNLGSVNEYIFPRPNLGSVEPLRSSDVLRYFANEAGLSNPKHITSTKLRKHVATVAQILKLDKNDLETMANFMGHDITVHRSFYRLPQEVLQVARMGRLLSAFNNGTVGQYSGKSIDDISLEEDVDLSSDDSGNDDSDDETMQNNYTNYTFLGQSSEVKEVSSSSIKTAQKIELTDEQRELLSRLFKTNVTMRRELRKIDCLNASTKYKCLQTLPWKKIKNTVHNWITVEKRKIKHF